MNNSGSKHRHVRAWEGGLFSFLNILYKKDTHAGDIFYRFFFLITFADD